MHALPEIRAFDSPPDTPFIPGPDWVLIVHAPALGARQPVRGSALVAGPDLLATREIDARTVRRRPPRAVVIDARERGADLRAVERFLADADLRGAVPTLLAAPLDLAGELDDVDADDLVVAPYTAAEIAARVRRIERRWQGRAEGSVVEVGALRIDVAAHRVELDGRQVTLTRLEYALLVFLVQHPGRVFTRDELLQRVWGNEGLAGGRTVDIHVRRLRAKLAHGVATLETVRGVGYRFMPSSPACLSPSSPVAIADSAWRPAAS